MREDPLLADSDGAARLRGPAGGAGGRVTVAVGGALPARGDRAGIPARARHRHVPDCSRAARGPAADAVAALGETAVTTEAACLVLREVRAAGSIFGPTVTAVGALLHLTPGLAEGRLGGTREAGLGRARILCASKEGVARAGITVVAGDSTVGHTEAARNEGRAVDCDHATVITGRTHVPIVAGNVAKGTGDALTRSIAGVGVRADVVVVARRPKRGITGRRADAALADGSRSTGRARGTLRTVCQGIACAVHVAAPILLATVELRT